MAVVEFVEHWDSRNGSVTSQPSASSTRVFNVSTDSITDDDQVVLAHASCPKPGDVHPNNSSLGCVSVTASVRESSELHWQVTAEYSTFGGTLLPWQEIENPLDRPVRLIFSWVDYEAVMEEAYWQRVPGDTFDGFKSIVSNIVGEYFDPPPMTTMKYPSLSVVRNEATLDLGKVIDYTDTLNSNAFSLAGRSVAKHQCWCHSINIGELQVENNVFFYQYTYTFHFARVDWLRRIANVGLMRWNQLEGRPEHITENGRRITKPVFLDSSGQPIPIPEPPDIVDPFYMVWRDKEEADFSLLGIF